MSRLARLLRHSLHDHGDARRALGDAALGRLQAQVAASEALHSGEVRLCVEAALPLQVIWQRRSARQRAAALFGELGVWNTENNNGVLIYLLLAEHAIEIVADRGLTRHVPQAQWDALIAGMRDNFRSAQFEAGLSQAIAAVDALLLQHFALAPGAANPDELPDSLDLR